MDPPPRRPWRKVAIVASAMTGARALDLYSTSVYDPALLGEQNLLRTVFHAGFAAIVVVNVLVVALLTALVARSEHLAPRLPSIDPGLRLAPFLSHLLFAGYHPWWHIAFRRPGRTRARWLLGRMVPWPAIGVSLLAVAGNFLSHSQATFASAWATLVGGPVRFLATLGGYLLAVLAAWLIAEYAAYRLGKPDGAAGVPQGLERSSK